LIVLLSFTSTLLSVLAQTSGDEHDALKKHLEVNDAVQIRLAQDRSLPSGKLKVFLGIGLDTQLRDNFVRWINDWNRKDGKKFGEIEIVSELQQADIIFARYAMSDRVSNRTDTKPMTTSVYNPNTNQLEQRTIARTYSRSVVPAYGYVLRRIDNRLDVLSRYSGSTSVATTKRSGQHLWDSFTTLMKQRAKTAR
jgi:hypothetical protein